jgi:hypothetical protein
VLQYQHGNAAKLSESEPSVCYARARFERRRRGSTSQGNRAAYERFSAPSSSRRSANLALTAGEPIDPSDARPYVGPGRKAARWKAITSFWRAPLQHGQGQPVLAIVALPARAGGDSRAAIASTMPARSKSARCSPPPSRCASWLRPRSRRRRNDVGGRIIIGDIRNEPLANDVGGEQTLNIGKAGQIAQKVAPSPGSAVSYVTSAHDVTCQG